MLADRREGMWIDLFAGVFAQCKVAPGDVCAILSETQSRALNVQLSNEHPEVLERLAPSPADEQQARAGMRRPCEAKEMKVSSPAGTALSIRVEGARVDDEGYYWIMGRSNDLIISGGENVYPAELENVLADCPQIAEAAVLGIEDAKRGEAACAVVVRGPGARLDEDGVLALFADRLARFKHPRRVVFVDELPKNALGKVQRGELRKLL